MPKSQAGARQTSRAQEDYLRALLSLSRGDRPVATSLLAERMGVNPASVSEMLTKLAEKDLVRHDRYRGATLTESGSALATEMTRHHRILETFLVKVLGYSWDEVHEEADRLEHAISEKLEHRMWEALGRPRVDPHGDEIPAYNGKLRRRTDRALAEATPGTQLQVTRISDRDPDKLRALRRLGVEPGQRIVVVEPSRWDGPIGVTVGAGGRKSLPLGLAREVFVDEVA